MAPAEMSRANFPLQTGPRRNAPTRLQYYNLLRSNITQYTISIVLNTYTDRFFSPLVIFGFLQRQSVFESVCVCFFLYTDVYMFESRGRDARYQRK